MCCVYEYFYELLEHVESHVLFATFEFRVDSLFRIHEMSIKNRTLISALHKSSDSIVDIAVSQ